MPASEISAFDPIAADYDASFSRSLTGHSQRMQAREWLMGFLQGKKELNILEINCGTGEDALWLASLGHRVTATDASGAMIAEAKNKQALMAPGSSLSFMQCAFADLSANLDGTHFDLVFSNFSGLNCIPAEQLRSLDEQLNNLLAKDGHIAAVIFGKYSWWETVYYLLKGKPGKASRRWKKKASVSELAAGSFQPVYYYSTRRFCSMLKHFKRMESKPVGLFVPPSYLESYMQTHLRLFQRLERWEKKAGGSPVFSQLADHQYLLLKKK